MGGGSFSSSNWQAYASANFSGKTTSQIYAAQLNEDVDPLKFRNGIRESVDGPDNPNSTPVMLFSDMTSSMGPLAQQVVSDFATVAEELRTRAPVPDVHILVGTVGDAFSDGGRAPIQATQFEADERIAEQLQKLWLTNGGGGNRGESYALAWLFAAMKTATDSYDKRKKKGYIFTIGDEGVHGVPGSRSLYPDTGVTKQQAKQWLDLDIERDLTAEECLRMAQRKWNVMHIVVKVGAYAHDEDIETSFGKIMPGSILYLEDLSALSETIVSAIEVTEGRSKASVASSWNGSKSVAVANALNGLVVAGQAGAGTEVVRL